MEIRTIGSSSMGVRPATDGAVATQAAQKAPSEQVAVQTSKAVPQVFAMESTGGMRKSADSAEAAKVNPDMSSRMAAMQLRAERQKVAKGQEKVEVTDEADEAVSGDKRAEQQSAQPLDEAEKQAEKARAEQAMKSVNESLVGSKATQLSFSVDEELGRVIVKIVDPETDEVIKQIPSEDAVALTRSLGKMTGVFLKAQA